MTTTDMEKAEMLITEEILEVGARAACVAQGVNPDEIFHGAGKEPVPLWRFQEPGTRAALTAVLPLIVEECAKYLKDLGTGSDEESSGNEQAAWRLEELAASLRVTSNKGE